MNNYSRRRFMKNSALTSLVLSLGSFSSGESDTPGRNPGRLRFGVIADVHKDFARDAEKKLAAFIDEAIREKPDFIIQLGDFTRGKDGGFEPMMKEWNRFPGAKYHVLGNHDMDYASKETVMKAQGMPGKYYSYDAGGYHCVVLDANYKLKDGKYVDFDHGNYYVRWPNRDLVNPEQIEWLAKDLASTDKPCILFSHEAFDEVWENETVPNRLEIRRVIREANAKSGSFRKVVACFCGHHHLDEYSCIEGVHYFQINSAAGHTFGKSNYKDPLYAFVTIDSEIGRIRLRGKRSAFEPPLTDEQRKIKTNYMTRYIRAEIQDRNIVI